MEPQSAPGTEAALYCTAHKHIDDIDVVHDHVYMLKIISLGNGWFSIDLYFDKEIYTGASTVVFIIYKPRYMVYHGCPNWSVYKKFLMP